MTRARLSLCITMFALMDGSSRTVAAQAAPTPELFNHGRTRSFRGATHAAAGDQLFVTTRGDDRNAANEFREHIAVSRYANGQWLAVTVLKFFDVATTERNPAISPDGRRLYFSSSAAPSGREEQAGFRVWFVERTTTGWGTPMYSDSLNIRPDVSVSAVTANAVFLSAGDPTDPASYDVYRANMPSDGRAPGRPISIDAWNTSGGGIWAAVDPQEQFAVVVRSPTPDSAIMMLSSRDASGRWSAPRPLEFSGANWLRPYEYRFPFISHDRSALWLNSASRLFQLPTAQLLARQPNTVRVASLPRILRRSVPPLAAHEPELFFPLDLRTTNGITFSPDGRRIYVSQYTDRRDERGRRNIRMFESQFTGARWTQPVPLRFGESADSPVAEEYHPVLAPDGRTLYFNSRRQANGSVGGTNDLWRVRRTTDSEWSAPEPVHAALTTSHDDYASIVQDGSVYFRSDRAGGLGLGDIYAMRAANGVFQPPTRVDVLNSDANENDVSVDATERIVVFNRFFPRTGEIDLFLSVRRADGEWQPPRPLTAVNTVVDWELTPTLSPDRRYLYVEIQGALVRWRLDTLLTDDEKRVAGFALR